MIANRNLSSPTFASLGRALLRFLAWWQRELLALLPPRLLQWWRGFDRSVLVTLTNDGAAFERSLGSERQAIVVDPGEVGRTAGGLGALLARKVGGRFRLILRLDPRKVLIRHIELPLAVEENLAQTVRFELDRYTPFKPDQAYFNFRVIGRDSARQRLSLIIAVAARTAVDHELTRCRELGLAVDGVVPQNDHLDRDEDYLDLLPSNARSVRQPVLGLRWRIALGSLALLLLAAVLALPLWQKREAAISLLVPLAEAKEAAQATDALRDRLNRLVADYNFLPAKKWEAHSTVRLLDELSRRLPDDTFVVQLDFDGKGVQVQGESGSAAGLVETLEASPVMKDVGYKAQLTKIQGTGTDRFHVAATLEHPPAGAAPTPAEAETPAGDAPGEAKP